MEKQINKNEENKRLQNSIDQLNQDIKLMEKMIFSVSIAKDDLKNQEKLEKIEEKLDSL